MADAEPDKVLDVIIIEHIKGHFPLFSVFDKPHGLHDPQLVRDPGLREADESGNVVDAQFAPGKDEADLQARLIPQHFEDLGKALEGRAAVDGFAGILRGAAADKYCPWCPGKGMVPHFLILSQLNK